MSNKKPTNLGATGKFPKGKLNKNDEGELRLAIFKHKENIIIDFNKSVTWIGFPKNEALNFAKKIIDQAKKL